MRCHLDGRKLYAVLPLTEQQYHNYLSYCVACEEHYQPPFICSYCSQPSKQLGNGRPYPDWDIFCPDCGTKYGEYCMENHYFMREHYPNTLPRGSQWDAIPTFDQWLGGQAFGSINIPSQVRLTRYLITFTKKPEVDMSKWKARVEMELERSHITQVINKAFEHMESNPHCHAYVEVKRKIDKLKDYPTFIKKFGFVDIRLIKKDNGVSQYFLNEEA